MDRNVFSSLSNCLRIILDVVEVQELTQLAGVGIVFEEIGPLPTYSYEFFENGVRMSLDVELPNDDAAVREGQRTMRESMADAVLLGQNPAKWRTIVRRDAVVISVLTFEDLKTLKG